MVVHQAAHTVAVLALCRRLQVSLPFSGCAPTIRSACVGPCDSYQIRWLVFRSCVARVTSCNAGVLETLLRTAVSALFVYRAVLGPPILCWALHSCTVTIASVYQITNTIVPNNECGQREALTRAYQRSLPLAILLAPKCLWVIFLILVSSVS